MQVLWGSLFVLYIPASYHATTGDQILNSRLSGMTISWNFQEIVNESPVSPVRFLKSGDDETAVGVDMAIPPHNESYVNQRRLLQMAR
jgi:hypothetical protein